MLHHQFEGYGTTHQFFVWLWFLICGEKALDIDLVLEDDHVHLIFDLYEHVLSEERTVELDSWHMSQMICKQSKVPSCHHFDLTLLALVDVPIFVFASGNGSLQAGCLELESGLDLY